MFFVQNQIRITNICTFTKNKKKDFGLVSMWFRFSVCLVLIRRCFGFGLVWCNLVLIFVLVSFCFRFHYVGLRLRLLTWLWDLDCRRFACVQVYNWIRWGLILFSVCYDLYFLFFVWFWFGFSVGFHLVSMLMLFTFWFGVSFGLVWFWFSIAVNLMLIWFRCGLVLVLIRVVSCAGSKHLQFVMIYISFVLISVWCWVGFDLHSFWFWLRIGFCFGVDVDLFSVLVLNCLYFPYIKFKFLVFKSALTSPLFIFSFQFQEIPKAKDTNSKI